MKAGSIALAVLALTFSLTGCAGPADRAAGTTASPSAEAIPPEAILLLTPGNGSRLVGRVHVEGVADSTFGQTLVVQVAALGDDGEQELAQTPVLIEAELGQRGPFAADLQFTTSAGDDLPGEVRVFSTSPRDGGIVHLTTAQVRLGASGASEIRPAGSALERIVILSPGPGARIEGGRVRIEGIALASFEQTLLAEVFDVDGRLVGGTHITVAAPDLGQHGPFLVEIDLAGAAPGPARIVVRDPSPAFGQSVHLASVEIQIGP